MTLASYFFSVVFLSSVMSHGNACLTPPGVGQEELPMHVVNTKGVPISLKADPGSILYSFKQKRRVLNKLIWSPALAKFAERNAAECHPKGEDKFRLHENKEIIVEGVRRRLWQIGETRYFGSGFMGLPSVDSALESWTAKGNRKRDDYRTTVQILAPEATHVGCGRAYCPAASIRMRYRVYCEFVPGRVPSPAPQSPSK